MGVRWAHVVRCLVFGLVLVAFGHGLAACGQGAPAGDDTTTASGPTHTGTSGCLTAGTAGCSCTQAGQTTACGKVVDESGSYVTCSMGQATCDGHVWGPCLGDHIVEKSITGRSLLADSLRLDSFTGACTNACDPNPSCTAVIGTSSDVDASGVTATAGGVTLSGADAATAGGDGGVCTGLQCNVVRCGGDGGVSTTITGIVYDPAGANPLYNATVYVPVDPTGTLPAFSSGASCDQCSGASAPYAVSVTTTATDGSFTLTSVPSGTNIPIVVQMGKWRRELLLSTVTACTSNSVTSNCTASDPTMCILRLPRNKYDGYDAADGAYDRADLPQMALVSGSADPLECMLLKAGIDPSEFSSYDVNPSAKIHFYSSPDAPGSTLDSHYGNNKTGDVLWLDPGDPKPSAPTAPHYDFYDVVLLPCEGASIDKEPLYTASGGGEPYKNLINYTDLGGRVFATHFGYVWLEYPSLYKYVAAPDNWSTVANWISKQGTYATQDPLTATLVQTFPKGAAFAQWLQNVGATSTLGQLTLHQARQDLTTAGANAQAWMTATDSNPPYGSSGNFDPHFTFNTPYGAAAANQCGRLVFSDFHVSASALVGSSDVCQSNADCGFTQTCVGGSTGGGGTCNEPCGSSADCADSTYSCVGATGGTCQASACTGTTKWSCSNGGTCNSSHTACLCTADSQCASGKCVNSQSQCSTWWACTGTGTYDTNSCAVGTSSSSLPATCTAVSNYACANGNCDNVTSSSGTCGAGGTPCWCTSDSQCASGVCRTWSGCGRRACSGSSTASTDGFNCVGSSLPATPTSSQRFSCTLGVPNSTDTACECTTDSQCSSGKCVNGGQCTGTCTGSGSAGTAGCQIPVSTTTGYACTKGGCDTASGACSSSGQGCYCKSDSQCTSGKCAKVTGQNDLSCGSSACSGSSTATRDGFDCVLASPGLPAAPTASGTTYTCAGSSTCVGSTSCYCDQDSFCPSGKCVKITGKNDVACGASNCTGTAGTQDFQGCQAVSTLASFCNRNSACGTSPFGICSSSQTCYCTDDSMCDSGHCVVVPGVNDSSDGSATRYCGSSRNGTTTTCTGTGTPDAHGCQPTPTAVACTANTTYTCAVGKPNSAGTACQCTTDSQCSSGKCVNAGQCTGTCTGSGTSDTASCQVITDSASSFSCATGNCSTVASSTGTCTAAGTSCWCTADSQCTSGKCISWVGCAAGSCTGTGTADSMHCSLQSPGIPAAPTTSTVYSCAVGAPNSAQTQCQCTADSQCSSGKCVNAGQCTGTCTGAGTTDAASCQVITSAVASTTYTCSTGTCSSSGVNCLCTADSQCASGACINQGQCASRWNCTGSGTADSSSCVAATPGTCSQSTTYACSVGTCNSAHTACQCTADSQCASGQCVNQGQCTQSWKCTGTGTGDSASCVPSSKTSCYASADCGSLETCGGTTTPALGTCSKACTTSAQCTGGESCVGGKCQGCSSSAQCTDNTYTATCTGGAAPKYGTCCYPQNEPNPAIPPNQAHSPNTSSCSMDSHHFPQACVQKPLSAQEKALEFMFFDLTACVTPDSAPTSPPPAVTLAPSTFSLDFTASCPSGTHVRWREFDWQASFPNPSNGSSISLAAQTGPVGADAAGMTPATPLPLVTTSTSTAVPGFDVALIDTAPGGTGKFTTASPPVQSQALLRIWVTMNPTSDALASPTLISWQTQYDCPASE